MKLNTRNHIFHETTRSLCPECRQLIDAQVILREGAVYLRKHCPEHGWSEALVSSDAYWYLKSSSYNRPGSVPLDFAKAVEYGCPSDCGLCTEHQQHTCVGLIEITSRCDLSCPVCFAKAGDSPTPQDGFDMSLEQVERILDRYVETEGEPEVVQISGGEPTLHPQIVEILAAARKRNIRHVMLNTNGLRLARDPGFARLIAPYVSSIYLQFDGLTSEVYEQIRGRDLLATKYQALENITQAGMFVVLVPTIMQGINDHQLGDLLRFGMDHPAIWALNCQAATYAGRFLGNHDPLRRTTVTDILDKLVDQGEGLLMKSDFLPIPCPHPTCAACTYLLKDEGNTIPLTRLISVEDSLDFVVNRAAHSLSPQLQPVIETLIRVGALGREEETPCCGVETGFLSASDLSFFAKHFFVIQAHGFMDAHTFDLKRIMKCCIHQLLPDGRAIPFCVYNNLPYRDEVKLQQEARNEQGSLC